MSGDFMNESNLLEAWEALTRLDSWLDFNLWSCPNNGCADIVIPVLHWLEVNTGRVSQGAGASRRPGSRLRGAEWADWHSTTRLPGSSSPGYKAKRRWWWKTNPRPPNTTNGTTWTTATSCRWAVASVTRSRSTACSRTPPLVEDRRSSPDGPDFPQYAAKFQEEGWFDCRKWHPERWGTYRRWEMGYRRQQGGYNLYAAIDEKCGFMTPTAKVEVWSTIAETYIPDGAATFASTNTVDPNIPDIDKFPHWGGAEELARIESRVLRRLAGRPDQDVGRLHQRQLPGRSSGGGVQGGADGASGQRVHHDDGSRQPVYFHSEHRQLPWCRELWPSPRLR